MAEVSKFIFLFLIGSTVLNLVIAITARYKTGYREFGFLILYWLSLCLTYFAVALLNSGPREIALAYFFQFFSTFILSKFLRDSLGIDTDFKKYFLVQIVGMLISAWLLFYSEAGFTLSLLPVTFTTTLPLWTPAWRASIRPAKSINWIERFMGLILFTGIIHHFNYAFFRMEESNAWWGWAISFAQYQCISVLLPLLINHRRSLHDKNNLEMLRQLKLSNSQLKEEREVNELLIKTVSHDLANPITVINSYMKMLQNGTIPAQEKDQVFGRMKMNVTAALEMIARIRNAILTRNKAEHVTLAPVDISNILQEMQERSRPLLTEKNLSLILLNSPRKDLKVIAEVNSLLEHVLMNILTNSIKFSHPGSQISITLQEQPDVLKISFQDQGVGIRPERFQNRFLGPTEGTAGEKGSGFGLMIMGYFLRKYGGSYELNSSTESSKHGTTVTICLQKVESK